MEYMFCKPVLSTNPSKLGHIKGDENALHVQRGIGLQSTDRQLERFVGHQHGLV